MLLKAESLETEIKKDDVFHKPTSMKEILRRKMQKLAF